MTEYESRPPMDETGASPESFANGSDRVELTARDKARVERPVPFVRESFFKGERFADLADAQRRVELWCRGRAGCGSMAPPS